MKARDQSDRMGNKTESETVGTNQDFESGWKYSEDSSKGLGENSESLFGSASKGEDQWEIKWKGRLCKKGNRGNQRWKKFWRKLRFWGRLGTCFC